MATRPDPPFWRWPAWPRSALSAWQIQAALPLNHDVGWLLLGARRLLDAGRLSADRFVDVTPPLILGLYALPVAASRALGVSEIAALRIFVIGLAAGSLGLCQLAASRLLRAASPPRCVRAWLVTVAIVLLPLVGYDFGQREHLITLLLLPYLVGAAARAHAADPPRSVAIWIGAAAGLAIGMKPQFALVVLAAEGVVWHARRRWRAVARPRARRAGGGRRPLRRLDRVAGAGLPPRHAAARLGDVRRLSQPAPRAGALVRPAARRRPDPDREPASPRRRAARSRAHAGRRRGRRLRRVPGCRDGLGLPPLSVRRVRDRDARASAAAPALARPGRRRCS